MPQPALTRRGARQPRKVRVHIYRLTNVVLDATLSALLGGGIYHTGVEIDGIEYAYGWHATSDTGVWMQRPTELPAGFAGGGATLLKTLDVGVVSLSPTALRERIVQMMEEWPGERYDALRHNCNHFSAALIACALESTETYALPPWVNAIAGVGSAVLGTRTGSPSIGHRSQRSARGLNGAFAHPGAARPRPHEPDGGASGSDDVAPALSLNFISTHCPTTAEARSNGCLGRVPRWNVRPRVHPSSDLGQAAERIAGEYARRASLGRPPTRSRADAALETQLASQGSTPGPPPGAAEPEAAPSRGDSDAQLQAHSPAI